MGGKEMEKFVESFCYFPMKRFMCHISSEFFLEAIAFSRERKRLKVAERQGLDVCRIKC